MPMQSKAQNRLMHGIASGSIKPGDGKPTREVAQNFVRDSKGQDQSRLPNRKPPPRK